ncbi:MAG: SPFH/Band 7/PHB domain protein [Oscillospiraceae bacterium]|nr:SPFH/Band 7/PHB domain protein [Oscillospiraceae bacterium]
MEYIIPAAIIIIILVVVSNIRVVQQATAQVVERMGAYSATWGVGLHLKVPFIERVAKVVTLKEQVADFPPQPVITKDNVTMQIDTVVYFQITDPKLYTYGIENPMVAIENLSATTLRNIIGELELDQTLTSRDVINTKMRSILDEATDPWGIKVNRVELKNILPPREIQNAMEKQMKAERERREAILRAEGEKKSAILIAEGEKESAILRAEAQKVQMVREAEGHAESIRLHKEAEANGMIIMKEAEAKGVELLKNAGMSQEQIIQLRSLEAFTAAADGKATKIIIPSQIQSVAGLAEGILESVKDPKPQPQEAPKSEHTADHDIH